MAVGPRAPKDSAPLDPTRGVVQSFLVISLLNSDHGADDAGLRVSAARATADADTRPERCHFDEECVTPVFRRHLRAHHAPTDMFYATSWTPSTPLTSRTHCGILFFVLMDIATGVALFRLGLTSRDAIGRHVLDM